jgi:hypothetical protein
MLELIYPHAPSVFGPFREKMMEERPEFFEGVEEAE